MHVDKEISKKCPLPGKRLDSPERHTCIIIDAAPPFCGGAGRYAQRLLRHPWGSTTGPSRRGRPLPTAAERQRTSCDRTQDRPAPLPGPGDPRRPRPGPRPARRRPDPRSALAGPARTAPDRQPRHRPPTASTVTAPGRRTDRLHVLPSSDRSPRAQFQAPSRPGPEPRSVRRPFCSTSAGRWRPSRPASGPVGSAYDLHLRAGGPDADGRADVRLFGCTGRVDARASRDRLFGVPYTNLRGRRRRVRLAGGTFMTQTFTVGAAPARLQYLRHVRWPRHFAPPPCPSPRRPASLGLGALGVLGLMVRARRRKAAA